MMKTVTIYSQDTGGIHSCITCPSHEIPLNIPEGHAAIEGFYSAEHFTVENGIPKEKPTKTPEEIEAEELAKAWEQLRRDRDFKLSVCDWTQVPDAPVDRDAWAVYRQALRDVPQQAGFPTDIIWPEKPQ